MSIDKKPVNNPDIDIVEPKKQKQLSRWIVFVFLIIIYSVIYFFVMNLNQLPELKALKSWIKFLVYIFVMVIFFGPFIPIKRRGGKRVSIINSLVKMMEGPKKRRYKQKPQSSLNVEYKPPLISKCKCGFIITRQMEKCPNCKRINPYYYPKD